MSEQHMTTVVLRRQEAADGALSVAVIVGGQVMEEVPCETEEQVTRVMQDIVRMMTDIGGPQVTEEEERDG